MARGEQEQLCLDNVKDLFNRHKVIGLGTQDKYLFFKNAFQNAEANPEKSMFPDFIFEDGFIEHFQVTSTKETRNGSEYKKEEHIFQKNVQII